MIAAIIIAVLTIAGLCLALGWLTGEERGYRRGHSEGFRVGHAQGRIDERREQVPS